MKVKLNSLHAHETNSRIYSPTDLTDLVESLGSLGQLESISITKQKTIISGHRRVEAMRQLGWSECEAQIVRPENTIIALVEHNRHRQKTHADILNEMRFLEKELKSEIGRGRKASTQRTGKNTNKNLRMALELANKIGLKETQVKKLRSISKYQPKLIDKIDKGEITLNKAYEQVRSKLSKANGNGRTRVDEFEVGLKKLLKTHKPSSEQLQKVLSRIWPHSMAYSGVSEERRDELVSHLEYLKQLDSHEYLLAQKQDELEHSEFSKKQLRQAKSYLPTLEQLELFFLAEPTKDDIEIIVVGQKEVDRKLWNVLHLCIHNMEHVDGPGRRLSAVVGFRHRKKLKILGLISFQSPSRELGVRDDYIGWNIEQMKKRREQIVNLHVCVSSQPFGHNFLGGKFLAMMSVDLVDKWEKKYKTKVVGLETTSLHGDFSQYSSMKWWKKLGKTQGKILYRPFREIRSFWRDWLRENYRDIYDECQSRSGPLQNMLSNIYSIMGLKVSEYQHGLSRGVFFCSLYQNTTDYLAGTDKNLVSVDYKSSSLFEKGKHIGIGDVWFDWWYQKAMKRYQQLESEKQLQEHTLFHEPDEEHYKKIERWLRSRGVNRKQDYSDFKV